MRIAVRGAGLMIALALLTASALAQQQAPERKPVPTFTDEDAPAGSAMHPASVNGSSDSWSRANAAWPQLKSLRARMTMDSPNGRVEALLEAVQPDRFHMAARGGIEIITVGESMYIKIPGASWERQAISSSQTFSFKGLIGDEFLKGGEPKLVGAEKIDGIDTDVYEVTSSMGLTGTARVWIGKSDGFPRKLAGRIGLDGASGIPIIVTFYDFNRDDISIKAPM